MPEVERLRDPIGANRGKSLREHASIVSKKAQNHYHEKYFIPPYRPTNRNWEMTFAALGWNRRTIEKFWKLFCKINHSSGAIQLEHFLDFFDLDWTKWTERCFTYFDTTGGGDIDFLEFMVSVWNVCTFKIESLSNFTFDMYDLDCDGELSIPEIENMVRELFGDAGGKLCLREATIYAAELGGALNLNAFISFTATHQTLLFPMFQIQRKIQKKVFGVQFWEEIERSSKEEYDHTGRNRNEFNPRHVQILLRTYQTGGAVAVLSHTGDPNFGLRDWYENQKQNDEAAQNESTPAEAENKTGLQRWAVLRETLQSKSKATQKWGSMKRNILSGTLDRLADIKKANVGADDLDIVAAASAMGGHSKEKDSDESKRRAIPRHIAERMDRIRTKHQQDGKDSATTKMSDQNDSNQVIRQDSTEQVTPARGESIPPDVAERLQRIRAARLEAKKRQVHMKRPRPRARETVIPNNVRQRQVGTIFYKPNDGVNSRDWLK
ncbi:hypothetical protein ACHAXM_004563 [Skeletonema potamos]